MKKIIKYLFLALFAGFTMVSCDFLDVVPAEKASDKDAFSSPKAAERFLYSCYGYIPQINMVQTCLDFSGDEIISPFTQESYVKFAEGVYTSGNLIISYWNDLFLGIRQCYLLKKNITSVPRIDQATIDSYVAQADFLIAYFHMLLIKCYGPVVLVKELPVLDTPKDNLLGRTSYDECVQWTCDMFDDAAGRLPATRTGSEYGLATSVAAKALKARLLLYAASPLFNGNTEYYSDFVNTDGSSLMPLSYDENKWKKAADAALEAINLAESNGYSLYEMREGDLSGYPEPQDLTQRTLRFTFMDKDNSKEVLFAETRKAGAYGLQPKSLPYLSDGSWNGVAPTLTMVERFYTKNGLPIDEDPEFDYQNRFSVVPFPDGATYGEGQTIKLNVDREPRFYAWIAFQNGYYECQTESKENAYVAKAERAEGKKWLTDFTEQGNCGKQGRNNNYSKTGYLNKKGVHPGVAASKSQKEPSKDYPWPVIRLAELYLSYAEACIAYNKDGYLEKGMVKLDRIRERAGLLSVKDSWKNAKNPIVSYEGNGGLNGKLTEIVRQERMIELYLEQQNFWDIRRWKLGDKYFNVPVKGMNIDATDINGFATVKTLPDDNTIRYIKVSYYDYLLEQDVVRLASVYADSVLIPDTRKKFGEYEFKVQSYSETGDAGNVQTIKAVSEPAPVQVVFGESKQIALTVDQLSTNAQEKSEGPIANLIDGNTASYFHTSWSGTVPPAPHWFQIDTKKEITYFKYESVARNGNNIPDDVDIMGSNDGVNFELIENLTKAKNGMLMSTSPYTSPVMGNNSKPYRYIRYSVNHTNTGSVFFSMSEFKLFEVDASVVDPEAD